MSSRLKRLALLGAAPTFTLPTRNALDEEETPVDAADSVNELGGWVQIIGEASVDIRLDDLVIGRRLGKGNFGDVHKVTHRETGAVYARKRLSIRNGDETYRRAVIQDIRMLRGIQCKNIVKLDTFFIAEGDIHILLEYMNCGAMDSVLLVVGAFPERVVSQVVRQVLLALDYIHKDLKIHRDLKPANILVNDLGECKLADFGMSNVLGDRDVFQTFQGDVCYMSPERIQGQAHSFDSDIFSLGLVALELLKGSFPLQISTDRAFFDMLSALGDLSTICDGLACSEEFCDFVGHMIVRQPDERWSAEQLLEHRFIRMYREGSARKPSFRSWLHGSYILQLKKLHQARMQSRRLKKKRLRNPTNPDEPPW